MTDQISSTLAGSSLYFSIVDILSLCVQLRHHFCNMFLVLDAKRFASLIKSLHSEQFLVLMESVFVLA